MHQASEQALEKTEKTTAVHAGLRHAALHGTAALLGAAALLAALPAMATDGYFLNGNGAKSKGAGGVVLANPEDALATGANPAAATALGNRLDVGIEIFVPDRGAAIHGNGAGLDGAYAGNGTNPFLLPEFGYTRQLGHGLAFALAINGNGGMNTNYKDNPFRNFGATGPAGVDLKQIFVTPSLALDLGDGQSVGLSPIFLVQAFSMQGIAPFASASSAPDSLTNRGTNWATGLGFRLGYLGRFGDQVALGAFYQSKVWAGRFDKYRGLFAGQGSFDVPPSFGAGVAFHPVPAWTIGADYKRIQYSKVAAVGNPLAPLFQGKPFGASDGPGFGWRDIDVWKLGASYRLSPALTLRAGYGHAENPVPRSETFLNILAPGVVTSHYTAGATARIRDGVELTGYLMRAPKQTVRGLGSIPAPYGGGEADVHLAETAGGLSLGLLFP